MTATDIKVYRFLYYFETRNRYGDLWPIEYRTPGPVPIVNDAGKILGFAHLASKRIIAEFECAIDPATPERLDLETGARLYWLDANLEYRGWRERTDGTRIPTVTYIKSLHLTTEEIPGISPINKRDIWK